MIGDALALRARAHGTVVRMYDTNGKISRCMRRGLFYEHVLLEHIYRKGFTGRAVDVGANIGNHTLWFAIVCGMPTTAFEPIYTEHLRDNIMLNLAGDRAEIESFALGDCDGTATHHGQGRLSPAGADRLADPSGPDVASGLRGEIGRVVKVRTLDSFNLQNVTMIKIDVEGMEPAVLRGGEKTIRRDRPVIYAETWGPEEHTAISAVLNPWGYQVTARFDGRATPTPIEEWSLA
jgi:FkbM family methyltransferase